MKVHLEKNIFNLHLAAYKIDICWLHKYNKNKKEMKKYTIDTNKAYLDSQQSLINAAVDAIKNGKTTVPEIVSYYQLNFGKLDCFENIIKEIEHKIRFEKIKKINNEL